MERQTQQALQMRCLNRQDVYALLEQGVLDYGKIIHEFEFADGDLDGHFPQADRTCRNLVAAVFDLLALRFREVGMSFQIPEQDVRIQQQFHGWYSENLPAVR